jgi:acyl carrier protein
VSTTTLTREAILAFVSERLVGVGVPADQIVPEANLESLGLDSLDRTDIVQTVRRHFGIDVWVADFADAPDTVGAHLDIMCAKAGIQ